MEGVARQWAGSRSRLGRENGDRENMQGDSFGIGTRCGKEIDPMDVFLERVHMQKLPGFRFRLGRFSLRLFYLCHLIVGMVFLCLAVLMTVSNMRTREWELVYTQGELNPELIFSLESATTGLNVYYCIRGFYLNDRGITEDSPKEFDGSHECQIIRTAREARYFRESQGRGNLELLEGIPYSDELIFPCGLRSLTFFSDEYEFASQVGTASLDQNTESDVEMLTYMTLDRDALGYAHHWIETNNERYMNWVAAPFTPSFQKLYGRLSGPLAPGRYSLRVVRNEWPDKDWKAAKSVKVSIPSFMGARNWPLTGLLFGVGKHFIYFLFTTVGLLLGGALLFFILTQAVSPDQWNRVMNRYNIENY